MFNKRTNGAEQVVNEVSKNANEFAREVRHTADEAKSNMVKTLYEAAKSMRREAREAGAADEVLERVDDVAKGFEKAATYLKRHSYEEMGEGAVKTIRTYPVQTLAIVLVIGVFIGLLLRGDSSSRDR
jgi:ElaB/YqjD/DUF883 family membrane-anchored ribosome-binding protein